MRARHFTSLLVPFLLTMTAHVGAAQRMERAGVVRWSAAPARAASHDFAVERVQGDTIVQVASSHRVPPALIGAAVGAAGGLAYAIVSTDSATSSSADGLAYTVLPLFFGFVGLLVGHVVGAVRGD